MSASTKIDYAVISIAGLLFCFVFFYRGSFSPILDVLENEFDTTSSGIGLMSSMMWFGYFIPQIPSGFLLEIVTPEFMVLVGLLGLSLTSLLFGFATNIVYASAISLLSGILISSGFLAMISLIGSKLGNNSIPFVNGVVFFFTYVFAFSMNIVQSALWDELGIWRPTYWALSILCFFAFAVFLSLNIYVQRRSNDNSYSPCSTDTKATNPAAGYGFPVIRTRESASSWSDKLKLLSAAFCNRWNYIVGIYLFCVGAVSFGLNGLWMVPYLMTKYEYSRSASSMITNSLYISSACSSLIMGRLSTKYKKRRIFMIVGACSLCCSVILIYLPSTVHVAVLIVLNVIAGVGCGIFSIGFAICREYNAVLKCSDVAAGLVNMITNSSGFCVQYVIGLLIDHSFDERNGDTDESGDRRYIGSDFQFAFVVIPICIGIALFISVFVIKETNGKSFQSDDGENSGLEEENADIEY